MAIRSVAVQLTANVAGFVAGMQTAAASVRSTVAGMTAATASGQQFRTGLDSVGAAAGRAGLVAAAGIGAIVYASGRFDKAMSAVEAATHESAQGMSQLREAALEAGKETAYSATEAAGAIEELAKAGVSTSDILSGGLDGALSLAAAGALDVGDAAEIAASAMTQFALEGSDLSHVADLLAAGAGKAQGSVSDLGLALKQSGLVAAQVGLSIEETTTALTAMASAGLTGSDAGTSLKTMLLALTPKSQEAAEIMEHLGLSAYDASGEFIGLEAYAGRLQDALKGMSAEQRTATLHTIFGTDAIRAANVLYDQGAEGIRKWAGAVDDSGYAAETAAKRLDNLAGDWEKFTGALETALIGAGDSATGPLRTLVQGATAVVEAFDALPASLKSAGVGLLAVTAIGGGLIAMGAKLITGLAGARAALAAIGPMAASSTAGLRRFGAQVRMIPGDLRLLATTAMTAGAQSQRSLTATTAASTRLRSTLGTLGKGAAGIAALTIATTGLGDSMGLTNTAMLALAGSMAGPWGAAAGAAVGLTLDLASAANEADKAIADWQAGMAKSEGSLEAQQDVLAKARAQLTAYNDDVSNAGWGKISNLFDPDAIMNGWEAFATGQSTVEKMAAALQDLEAQSAANEAAVVELAAAFGDDITPVWKDASVAADDYASTLERARPAMDALGLSVQDLADMDSSQLSDATKRIADWTKYADSGQGRTAALADAVSGLSSDMLSTADSAAELSTALDELLSPALDAEAATDAWRKALAELRTELSNTAGFSGYSEAAMKNREATRSYTEATIAMLKSRAEAGAGEKEIARLLQQSREEFIRQGVAAGQNAEVMRRRANILGLTPKLVRTVMEAAGVELTTRQVRKLREEYRGLPAKVRTQLETPGYQLTKKNIQELRREYDLTPAQVRTLIELRDAEARRAITGVQRELDKTGQMRPNPRVTADGSQASGVLSRLLDQMRALHDKSVTVTTTYVTRHIRKEQTESGMGPQPASLLGSLGGLQGARGGRRDQGWENAPKPDEPLRRFDTRMPVEQGARLSGITSELSELRSSMAEAGIRWTRSMTRQAGSLKVLGAAYDEQTEALDAAAQAVDQSRQSLSELQQEASAFGAQSIGRFNADLFAEDGLSGVMRRLGSNAGGAESMLSTLQALAAAGLDGEAFRMLAGSGDLRAAQQLLAGGSEAIAAYESGVARQLAAQQQLSQYVQDSVYGKAIADQTEVVRRQLAAMEQQQARLAELNAKIAAQTAVLEQAIKEEAPKRTGKEVADALSGVAADSARLRPRRPIDVGGPL